MFQRIKKSITWRIYSLSRYFRQCFGIRDTQWARVVMDRETKRFIGTLNYRTYDALEISGDKWKNFGFKTYLNTQYPEYDLCEKPLITNAYDIVIVEQVLEHVEKPSDAIQNAWKMLRIGGLFLVTTPFLVRIHLNFCDYSRWTERGLKNLLAESGFSIDEITAGSWGNQGCVRANFYGWANWIPWFDSLDNEPEFPIVVWAFARKT